MTTRQFGSSNGNEMAQAFAASVVVIRATVTAQRPVRGIRLYDLAAEDGPEMIPAAQSLLRQSKDHPGFVKGDRVLVMLLGDGGAFILGARQLTTDLANEEVAEAEPDTARTAKTGSDDQVLEGNGCRIVFTHDGDVVITAKRSLRMESNTVARLSIDGDADDSPVAGAQFLAWAKQVEAMLSAHEAWINANALTAPNHVHTPQVTPAALPSADGDMLSERLRLPTGKGEAGGAP